MRRKLFAVLVACLSLFGLFAMSSEAGAITDPGVQHWRKSNETGTNRQFLVYVHYDTDTGFGSSIDPSIRDNYTAQFSSELNQAIAKLDAHPDLRVVRETSSSIPCHDNFPSPTESGNDRNCVEFYRVSGEWLLQRTGAVGAIGAASWHQTADHIWNDNGSTSSENTWFAIYWGLYNGDPTTLDNVFCHELVHTFDIDHPRDGTAGPCNGSGVIDADDVVALDKTYCTLHTDAQPSPRGSTLGGTDAVGEQPCSTQLPASAPPTPPDKPVTQVVGDTLADLS